MAAPNLIYQDEFTGEALTVPLKSVKVTATIVESCVETKIKQEFYHNRPEPIAQAIYIFPIDDRASVSGFDVQIGETMVKGTLLEKNEAKLRFEKSTKQGLSAQLLTQIRGDVFQLQLSNIRAFQTVEVTIRTIAELKLCQAIDSETKNKYSALEYFLPTFVTSRYHPETETNPVGSTGPIAVDEGLTLSIKIRMTRRIRRIYSPSKHDIVSEIFGGDTQANVTFAHAAALNFDFTLHIIMENPRNPTMISERNETGIVTMISFEPQQEFEEQKCEFIFLVDQSGSMAGQRNKITIGALQVFLKSVPEDCFFNIVRFGSTFSSLFPSSMRYDAASLAAATKYVAAFEANLGGTEILKPLKHIFSQPQRQNYLRQIFVLTDGEVSNTRDILSIIQEQNTRIFSLGLGNGASHELVDGLAREGHGISDYVFDNENIETKVISLLKTSLQPLMSHIKIKWDVDTRSYLHPWENFAKFFQSFLSSAKDTARVMQAPYRIPDIIPGTRFTVFCIGKKNQEAATTARVEYVSPQGFAAIQLNSGGIEDGDLLHKMAAKALIRDLELGINTAQLEIINEETIKREVVKIALEHSIASSYTSFVAVLGATGDCSNNVLVPMNRAPGLDYATPRGMSKASLPDRGFVNDLHSSDLLLARGLQDSAPPSPMSAPVASSSTLFPRRSEQASGVIQPRSSTLRAAQPVLLWSLDTPSDPALEDSWKSLVALQQFDGRFMSEPKLWSVLNVTAEHLTLTATDLGLTTDVVATIMALAFFKKKLTNRESDWSLMAVKAKKWIKRNADATIDVDLLIDTVKI